MFCVNAHVNYDPKNYLTFLTKLLFALITWRSGGGGGHIGGNMPMRTTRTHALTRMLNMTQYRIKVFCHSPWEIERRPRRQPLDGDGGISTLNTCSPRMRYTSPRAQLGSSSQNPMVCETLAPFMARRGPRDAMRTAYHHHQHHACKPVCA